MYICHIYSQTIDSSNLAFGNVMLAVISWWIAVFSILSIIIINKLRNQFVVTA